MDTMPSGEPARWINGGSKRAAFVGLERQRRQGELLKLLIFEYSRAVRLAGLNFVARSRGPLLARVRGVGALVGSHW